MSNPAPRAPARRAIGPILYALVAIGLGHWLGGGVALGRVDAALLIPTLAFPAVLLVMMPDRWRPASYVAAAVSATAALIVLWCIGLAVVQTGPLSPQLLQSALLAGTSAAALTLILALHLWVKTWKGPLRWGAVALVACGWWLAAHVALGYAYTAHPEKKPGKMIMLTGLPLRTWPADGFRLGEMRETAAVMALRTRLARPLILADALAVGSLGRDDRLLLAHPLALPPETLVEVDRFVRAGGRAVILADGLSSWPPPFALGDRRNPPVTSLLTPLLDHWGVQLDAPVPGGATSETMTAMHLGRLLTMHSPGHFAQMPRNCRSAGELPDGQPAIATCRIGRGTAVLLADADMLFDPLWRPEPLWAAHLRPSDNIEWLAEQLNEPDPRVGWGLRPTWRAVATAPR